MSQGIQAITNYKTASPACDNDASLPDALNDFYTRFEVQNNVAARKTIPPPNDQILCLSMADVRRILSELTHGRLLDQITFLVGCSGNMQNS
ncbi:D(3) dopamine receptor, partial [Tachysurus ichikawai]